MQAPLSKRQWLHGSVGEGREERLRSLGRCTNKARKLRSFSPIPDANDNDLNEMACRRGRGKRNQ